MSAAGGGSSGLCCPIALCKSTLVCGALSHDLTLLSRRSSRTRRCSFVGLASLLSRPSCHILPSFSYFLALSTPSHRGSPHAHLRFIVFKRYSPPGHLTLALYTRRRQTLLLPLVSFIYIYLQFFSANDIARYLLRTPKSFFFIILG